MKIVFLDANSKPTTDAPTYFGFECPKRIDGYICTGLIIRDNPSNVAKERATWIWNGDRDYPTFSPSINCIGCSHGYIERGVWRDA